MRPTIQIKIKGVERAQKIALRRFSKLDLALRFSLNSTLTQREFPCQEFSKIPMRTMRNLLSLGIS